MDDRSATFWHTMKSLRCILGLMVLLFALTGLTVSGDEAAGMIPDQPTAMTGDGMAGSGMPDCDRCGGDAGTLAGCAMACGPSCAGELGQVPGELRCGLLATDGVSVARIALPSGAVRSPDPPRPKTHSL